MSRRESRLVGAASPLTGAERRACALITLLVYTVSSLPYLYGYLRQTATARFTGIVFDVVDTAQYFAWMRAFSHRPLIANPLTPEPGAERFFNLQWWLLGQLAYGTPLGPVATYQVLRVLALAGFAVALALLCRLVLRRGRVLAFALVMLASGFGWVLVVLKRVTGEPDLRFPLTAQIGEANTLFSAMAFPHLLVAGALILGIFVAFLSFERGGPGGRRRALAVIVVLTLVLGFSHGYDLLPLIAIPTATVAAELWRRRRLPALVWPLAAIIASAAPPALYVLLLTRLDPTWKGVLSQYGNAGVYTPPPPQLVILLGLPFLLAVWQLRPAAWREGDTGGLFLRIWLTVGFALLYIPADYQVKTLTTYQVPVALLAAQTARVLMAALFLRTSRRSVGAGNASVQRWVTTALIVFVALTNIYLTAWRVIDLRRAQYPYYLSAGDVRALEHLATITTAGDVVLSSPELGVFVPVYSDARPFVAHWAQTLHFLARRRTAAYLYRPDTPDEVRQAFTSANGITFIMAGPSESLLGGVGALPTLRMERLVDGTTTLYRTGFVSESQP